MKVLKSLLKTLFDSIYSPIKHEILLNILQILDEKVKDLYCVIHAVDIINDFLNLAIASYQYIITE
jgi:hypothetical protein